MPLEFNKIVIPISKFHKSAYVLYHVSLKHVYTIISVYLTAIFVRLLRNCDPLFHYQNYAIYIPVIKDFQKLTVTHIVLTVTHLQLLTFSYVLLSLAIFFRQFHCAFLTLYTP